VRLKKIMCELRNAEILVKLIDYSCVLASRGEQGPWILGIFFGFIDFFSSPILTMMHFTHHALHVLDALGWKSSKEY